MKAIIKTIWCIMVLAVSASAANYTVKSGGGGNYTTIQSCATAMAAGDTCTVYAGTYNESVTVPAGTAGNYKTLTVNPGDTVTITNTVTLASHTKLNGFNITIPSGNNACISIGSVTDVYATNNSGTSCLGINSSGTYIYLIGNTVYYPGSPVPCTPGGTCNSGPAMSISGNHVLLDGNNLSHFSDGVVDKGSFVIIRHNVQHDSTDTECNTSGHSSNCHIDEIETWGTSAGGGTTVVYESNTFRTNTGAGNAHLGYFQYSGGQQAITRFNTIYDISDIGWFDDSGPYITVKHYNETKVDVGGRSSPGATDYWTGSPNGSEFNGIFVFTGFNGSLPSGYAPYTQSSSSPFTSGCDLAYYTQGTISWGGQFNSDGSQKNVNPLFTNLAGNDYSLTSSSPARNVGCALTSANGSGVNSTTLVVNDAAFFQDSYGLDPTLVKPDCISITTYKNHVCIAVNGVNYATNTITLASPMTWNSGDSIWPYSLSDGTIVQTDTTGPDVGSVPYTSSTSQVQPPTALTALVN